MRNLTIGARPATLGGIGFAVLYSSLALVEDGYLSALDFVENHAIFHLLLAPVYAALLLALLRAQAVIGERQTRFGRYSSSLAIFGLAVGVLAGAIVPILEVVFNVETAEGTADAVIHIPEFMPMMVGTLLFGVAIAVSRLLPRHYGVFLALGAVAMFVLGAGGEGLPRIIGPVIFGLAWIALGYASREPRRSSVRPAVALAQ